MARKTHTPSGKALYEPQQYAAFIADLLDGTVTPAKLIETRPGGKLVLSYDESAQAQKAGR